ncbi:MULTISPECIES: hypothetical protein [unclassified Streptomyces]|uniref:hypothetical protein n=1 Tax=unclassified Streptomyces TaxID=2593676 RepID=UPI00136B0FFF|nr:hypothetical protein [Streptomyces sp. SID6139]MYR22815.1 hypothetical protein [Streptomyces sp. SID6137]
MADIARTALRSGMPLGARTAVKRLPLDAGTPQVADVWIDGDLGFVLLLHRRGDGLMAEELYYSACGEGGVWERPEHLSGGIVGVETADPSAVECALGGAPMSVVAESESLVYTRPGPKSDGEEFVHVWELLVSGAADLIEIERFSPALPEASALSRRDLTGPLVLLVLLPGERARVQAVRRGNASLTRLGAPLELHHPER